MIGSIYRVVVIQELWQQQVQNRYHLRSNFVTDSEAQVAEKFDAFITAAWAPIVTGDLKFKLIRVQRADGGGDLVHEIVPTTPAGTNAASSTFPSNVAAVLSFRSNTANRRKNGRTYISGTPLRTPQTDGKMNQMNMTELAGFGAALLSTFDDMPTTDLYTFGIYSPARLASPGKPAWEELFTACETVRVNPIYGAQRTRRIGVGA